MHPKKPSRKQCANKRKLWYEYLRTGRYIDFVKYNREDSRTVDIWLWLIMKL